MPDFYEKAKPNIDKFLLNVGIKSEEFVDSMRLKIAIHSLKNQKEEKLLEIGYISYKMYRRDRYNQEKINEMCRYIEQIDDKIRELEYEAEHVHEKAKKQCKHGKDRKDHKKHGRRERQREEEQKPESDCADEIKD